MESVHARNSSAQGVLSPVFVLSVFISLSFFINACASRKASGETPELTYLPLTPIPREERVDMADEKMWRTKLHAARPAQTTSESPTSSLDKQALRTKQKAHAQRRPAFFANGDGQKQALEQERRTTQARKAEAERRLDVYREQSKAQDPPTP